MTLPEDPMILLSLINMKLRDAYADLAALCEDMELDRVELEEKLGKLGYTYDEVTNCFM